MSHVAQQAKLFAEDRHANMCRPNKAKQPVIEHLAEVASLAEQAGASESAIAAAWLHDAIEDTSTTVDEVRTLFGDEVASYVDDLSDPKHFAPLPLIERKRLQTERLKAKDRQVKLVKLCDQISNVQSVLNDPPIVDWDDQKSLEYAKDAKLIADVCRGQSSFLDQKFDALYLQTVKKYSSST